MSLTGGPRLSTVPFKDLNSFSFDGVDDYIDCGDNDNLSFGNGTTDSPFSISAWVKMDDATRFYALSKGLVFSTNYEYLLGTNASDKLGLYLYDSSNNSRIGRFYNTSLTTYEDQWVHIVTTYNGSGLSSGIKVYLNGVRVDDSDSNSGTYVAMENGNRSLNIGRTETGVYANGLIDETAIFNSELSASDVTTIYNDGIPNNLNDLSTPPLSWFRMGDNAIWNGQTWIMPNSGTDTQIARSINMVEDNRTTDVPPNPFVNTLSTSFDGIDDYVETNFNADNFSSLSVSGWIKATNPQADYNVIISNHYKNNTTPYYQFVCMIDNNGKLYWRIGNTSPNYYVATSTTTIRDNSWHHFVGTYGNGNLKIYIDGTLEDTTSASGNLFTTGNKTSIGAFIDVTSGSEVVGGNFLGNIDEVSVFNTELSASDVTSIYNLGVPNDISSLSPISWWRCGDSDTSPTLTDNGSGGNDGTMTNMSSANFVTDVPTFNTKSISLDGIDDYVEVSDADNLSFGNGTTDSPFSISAWIKIGQTTAQGIVSKYGSGSSTREWLFYTSGGKLRLLFIDASNGANNFATGTINLSTNTWYHVACTYDGRGGSTAYNGITLYINGIAESLTTSGGSYTAMSNTSQRVEIGKYGSGSSTRALLGNIDEVSVFNSELSQSDITSIYNGGVPNDISSLSPLSWWRCGDGDTSPTLTDNGSASNDGTMTNFTTFSTDVPN